MTSCEWQTATAVLRLSAQLVEGIQSGVVERGFVDVRPVHGFAFVVLAGDDTTTVGLAAALGVTKQAAGQLVDHLAARGYLTREPDPRDGRAQILMLTERGHACTRAAEEAADEVVATWREQLPATTYAAFVRAMTTLAQPGRLRPSW